MSAVIPVRARPGTDAGRLSTGDPSGGAGKRDSEGEVRPDGFLLSGDVEFRYEVIGDAAAFRSRPTRVRVRFPAGARAVLETLSWREGLSIVETLDRLCRRAIARLGVTGKSAKGEVEIDLTASVFRTDLERILAEPLRLVPPAGR